MAYPIVKKLINVKPKRFIYPVGIVLHSTANPGATDQAHYNWLSGLFNAGKSAPYAHTYIDWDSITEVATISLDKAGKCICERAAHCMTYGNDHFLGVEMCEPKGLNREQFTQMWNRTVWYIAFLFVEYLKKYTVTVDNLLSHEEVSLRWKQSTHVDPVAFLKQYNTNVGIFRIAVQQEINRQLTNKLLMSKKVK